MSFMNITEGHEIPLPGHPGDQRPQHAAGGRHPALQGQPRQLPGRIAGHRGGHQRRLGSGTAPTIWDTTSATPRPPIRASWLSITRWARVGSASAWTSSGVT